VGISTVGGAATSDLTLLNHPVHQSVNAVARGTGTVIAVFLLSPNWQCRDAPRGFFDELEEECGSNYPPPRGLVFLKSAIWDLRPSQVFSSMASARAFTAISKAILVANASSVPTNRQCRRRGQQRASEAKSMIASTPSFSKHQGVCQG